MRLHLSSAAAILLLAGCTPSADRAASVSASPSDTVGVPLASAITLRPQAGMRDPETEAARDPQLARQVIGDSVHVFLANSTISVPATHIENVRYADNRLRFDIRGLGTKIFEVGDGTEGAVFRQADALQFVAFVVQRQNEIESRDAKTP